MLRKKFTSIVGVLCIGLTFFACSKEDDSDDNTNNTVLPTTLDCNYFTETRILENNPEAPIDYIIDCKSPVTADLTILPGVVIAFSGEAGLEVLETGSINAIGTDDDPITFTGVDKARGSWKGIFIDSKDVKNVFNQCIFQYAGDSPFNSNDDKGTIILYAGGKVTIENNTFYQSANYAINANYKSGRFVSIDNNSFIENEKTIYVRANLTDAIGTNNDFQNNDANFVEVGCNVVFENENGNKTWNALTVPYRISSTDFGITKKVTIPANGNLTIAPGTIIEFSTGTKFSVDDNASLSIVGTPSEKITLTGVDKAPGAWGGIAFAFTSSTKNEIAHTTIEYAADSDQRGAISMWADPKVSVHDCTFKDLEGCALFDYNNCFCNPNLTEGNNTFINADDYCHD